jgi:hypothetical protein
MDQDSASGVKVFACGMVGVILAMIEQTMYDRGIVIDEFVTGSIQMWEVMALTIIVWLLIGVVIAVSS